MAKTIRVWGIDIGQCAVKALRCTREGDQIVADAFDYVEYPKILSQPEADPEQLIREALEQFLSRNELSSEDRVAISVPGQSGLAKFFKPPPVDVKRIPEIVRYEARQQIPFPLEEVIWDFQQMAGGAEVDGFAIDTEVGLFAMKRAQVFRFLRPFEHAEIDLDIVQLSPLAIYNFVSHDVLVDGPAEDEFDPDDPPESVVVLSMGTDATDLVVTNGFRVWQRSIPLGGSHFTKQLTKEMKLTFAKAEHLKRNARQAEDPKTVFQAMRPIFNDMVTEIQRSIGFYQGIDRKAKIRGVVLLGNTVKLPGLQQYIAKNLGYEVIAFEKFNLLGGEAVTKAPAFNDNLLTYGVAYGLCIQGLGQARLSTNLLPREILTQRIIKAKKPWAIASASALMLACAFSFFFNYNVWSKVQEDHARDGVTWKDAEGKISSVNTTSSGYKSAFEAKELQQAFVEGIGEEVVGAGDRRLLWLELIKAVNSALPGTEGITPGEFISYRDKPLEERQELYIEYVESEYWPDLSTWYNQTIDDRYGNLMRRIEVLKAKEGGGASPDATTADAADDGTTDLAVDAEADAAASSDSLADVSTETGGSLRFPGPPANPGWVIEIKGYHYFNSNRDIRGATHVRDTLLRNLKEGSVDLPVDNGQRMERFTFEELGISYPVLAMDGGPPRTTQVRNPEYEGDSTGMGTYGGGDMEGGGYPGMGGMGMGGPGGMGMGMGAGGMGMGPGMGGGMGAKPSTGKKDGKDGEEEEDKEPPIFSVTQYSFVVQFVWQEKPLNVRLEERKKKLEEQQAAAEAAVGGEVGLDGDGTGLGEATDPGAADAAAGGDVDAAVPAGAAQPTNPN